MRWGIWFDWWLTGFGWVGDLCYSQKRCGGQVPTTKLLGILWSFGNKLSGRYIVWSLWDPKALVWKQLRVVCCWLIPPRLKSVLYAGEVHGALRHCFFKSYSVYHFVSLFVVASLFLALIISFLCCPWISSYVGLEGGNSYRPYPHL